MMKDDRIVGMKRKGGDCKINVSLEKQDFAEAANTLVWLGQ